MVVLFDRKELARHGTPGDKDNAPEMLVERREKSLTALGKFCGADRVEYIDHGKGEEYRIEKGDKVLVLNVSGNQFDGGYMGWKVEWKPCEKRPTCHEESCDKCIERDTADVQP